MDKPTRIILTFDQATTTPVAVSKFHDRLKHKYRHHKNITVTQEPVTTTTHESKTFDVGTKTSMKEYP